MDALKFIGKESCAVKFPSEMPEVKLKWTTCFYRKFPVQEVVLISVRKNCPDTVHIKYFNQGVTDSFTAPKNFKIVKMRGKRTEVLMGQYREKLVSDLVRNLGYGALTVGSDPEIFVENKNKELIPAFDFLGSKKNPTIGPETDGNTPNEAGNNPIYWDGFQAEFVTYPAGCLAWQVDSVQLGLKGVLKAARKHCKDAVLSISTTMDIPPKLLQDAKQEHVEFGCMPSYNAYNMKGLCVDGRDVPFRSAGGHIHFGLRAFTQAEAAPIVKALDAILGVACVSLFAKYDNPRRRSLYGLAGEYRLPSHGIEYRVLSNAWLAHPLIMNVVFDLARRVFVFGQKGFLKYWQADEQETIRVINDCDVDGARTILKQNEKIFLDILAACYYKEGDNKLVMEMFLNGMESVIKTPEDIVGNWNLTEKWVTHSDGNGKNWRYSKEIIEAGKKVA